LRQITTPKQKTTPPIAPAIDRINADDVAAKGDEDESRRNSRLDAYVQGLDNIDLSQVDTDSDSDTEHLLAELQKAIRESEDGDSTPCSRPSNELGLEDSQKRDDNDDSD
jgi:hypothetical protein